MNGLFLCGANSTSMICVFMAENGIYMSQKKHLLNIDDKMGAVTYKYDKGWCTA